MSSFAEARHRLQVSEVGKLWQDLKKQKNFKYICFQIPIKSIHKCINKRYSFKINNRVDKKFEYVTNPENLMGKFFSFDF